MEQFCRFVTKICLMLQQFALLAHYSASASLEATDACLMARFLARDSERRSLSSFSLAINSLWYSAASVFFCTRQTVGHCRSAKVIAI